MKKNAIVLILIMMFNKIFGIVREMALASMFGTSIVAEAYNIAYSIPVVVFSFVATGITTAYIPVFSRALNNEGDEVAEKFTSNVLNILIVVFAVLTILSQFFTKEIVLLFASGFKDNPELLNLTVSFTKITLFGVIFQGVFSIAQGYLQLKNDFASPGFSYILMNVTLISFIIITGMYNLNPMILGLGIFLSNVLQGLFAYVFARIRGFKHSRTIDFNDKYLHILATMAIPVIIGSSVDVINTMIDKNLASSIIDGGVSTMNYAVRISDSILGLFVTTAATVLFPTLSKYAAEGDYKKLQNVLVKTFNAVNLLVIPASFGLMVFSEPIVKLFYGRGNFSAEAVKLTSQVLFFYSIGTIAIGNRQIVNRVFQSTHDTRTPVLIGFGNVCIKVLLSLMFVYLFNMGLTGLAFATSISGLVTFVVSMYILWKKIGGFNLKLILQVTGKIMFVSIIMSVISRLTYTGLLPSLGNTFALFIGVFIGVIVYLGLLLLMKIDIVDDVILVVKSKLKRN